ncbi:MAG: TrkA family potassium uptake protein [Actinobacteria bacterium]|nr:MAG: TrkA family potassium uptake protein [Actinomycetota bacterium]
MQVLIVGAGKSGLYLAEKLRDGHEITIIEQRPERVAFAKSRLPGVIVLCGDGCEPSVLDRAGASRSDLVAALTGDDEDNLVVSLLSKRTHSVPLVFARTNHPKNEWLFTKTWGVDVAVSTAGVIYSLIESEVELGDIITLLKLRTADMEIEELVLPADAASVGKRIADLTLPSCTQIMAILSAGEVVVPRGDTELKSGDELLILSRCGSGVELRGAFGVHAEPR